MRRAVHVLRPPHLGRSMKPPAWVPAMFDVSDYFSDEIATVRALGLVAAMADPVAAKARMEALAAATAKFVAEREAAEKAPSFPRLTASPLVSPVVSPRRSGRRCQLQSAIRTRSPSIRSNSAEGDAR
jgi:hypothetical protein